MGTFNVTKFSFSLFATILNDLTLSITFHVMLHSTCITKEAKKININKCTHLSTINTNKKKILNNL